MTQEGLVHGLLLQLTGLPKYIRFLLRRDDAIALANGDKQARLLLARVALPDFPSLQPPLSTPKHREGRNHLPLNRSKIEVLAFDAPLELI